MKTVKTLSAGLAGLAAALFMGGAGAAQAEDYELSHQTAGQQDWNIPEAEWPAPREVPGPDVLHKDTFSLDPDDFEGASRLRDMFDGDGRIRLSGDVNIVLYERLGAAGRRTQFGVGDVRGRPGLVFKRKF